MTIDYTLVIINKNDRYSSITRIIQTFSSIYLCYIKYIFKDREIFLYFLLHYSKFLFTIKNKNKSKQKKEPKQQKQKYPVQYASTHIVSTFFAKLIAPPNTEDRGRGPLGRGSRPLFSIITRYRLTTCVQP